MQIVTGSTEDCKQIAQIYRLAFPESIDFFFKGKAENDLIDLLEASFKAIFYLGGQSLVIKNKQNAIKGYCFYKTTTKSHQERNYCALMSLFPRFITKVNFKELVLLMRNKVTMGRPGEKRPRPSAEIVSIAIDPQEQGKGLGNSLLENVLSQIHNKTIYLNVRESNKSARRLYEKSGFKVYGHTTDLSGKWLRMVKTP